MRAGTLDHDALRLAAYCDDPVARVALGDDVPARPGNDQAWLDGLGVWPGAPVVAALVDLADRCGPVDQPHLERLRAVLGCWLRHPGTRARAAVARTYRRACGAVPTQLSRRNVVFARLSAAAALTSGWSWRVGNLITRDVPTHLLREALVIRALGVSPSYR